MDPELQKLIRQLQDVKCPPSVMERVNERIEREQTPRHSTRFSLAWAVSIACVVSAIAFWAWDARRDAQLLAAKQAAAQTRADRVLVVQQTHEAFGYIGQALLRAAAHTEKALLEEAVPPLRNSFEIVKNKVTNPI